MLDLSRCRIAKDKEISVKSGNTIGVEGLALVSSIENGIEVVSPSAGATETFIGFSYGEKFTALTLPMVAEANVPATGTLTVTLPRNNIVPDQIFIYDNTAGAALTEGTVATGVYAIVDATGVITFHADEAGHNLTITFRYYPTTMEVSQDTDQFFYKPSGSDFLNSIGVILGGEVFTDQFDAAANWATATIVETAANGLLTGVTSAGSGTDIKATIINVPNTSNSFLGIRFNY